MRFSAASKFILIQQTFFFSNPALDFVLTAYIQLNFEELSSVSTLALFPKVLRCFLIDTTPRLISIFRSAPGEAQIISSFRGKKLGSGTFSSIFIDVLPEFNVLSNTTFLLCPRVSLTFSYNELLFYCFKFVQRLFKSQVVLSTLNV